MADKYCINCMHHKKMDVIEQPGNRPDHVCTRISAKRDLVTGIHLGYERTLSGDVYTLGSFRCSFQRSEEGACRPIGAFYVAKIDREGEAK